MGPAGRKGQFKTRAGARLPAVRPAGPRRRTHSPQTKDPQVGGRGGGRGPPSDRPAGPAPSAVPVPSHASYGSFPSRIAEGQEPSASREAAGGFCGSASSPTPAPRQQGGLHPPQLVLLRLLCGPTRAGRLGGSLRGSGTAPPCPAVIWKDGAARHVCTCDLVTHQQAQAHWGGTTHESVCPLRQPTCCAARTQQREGARVSTRPTAFPREAPPRLKPRDLTTATSRLFPFSALFYNLTRAYQTRNSSNLNMAFGPRIIRDFYLIFCFEIHHPARFAST